MLLTDPAPVEVPKADTTPVIAVGELISIDKCEFSVDSVNITNIAPLTTEYIHYLFEVPEEVQSSSEGIVISFSVSGNSYTYTVR